MQWAWMKVLLALLGDDSAAAEAELQKAREQNRDAMVCSFEIHKAWDSYPNALHWLKEHELLKERKGKRQ